MMFSAGMGIGLMFFGVAEPISHLAAPPLGLAKPNTEAAAATAMEWTYFHWALQAWALYAVVGLALGYFCFRKGMPNLISSVFYPLLGDRVNGPIGKAIDILAIFATMFGSATSLGLGALQINSGLNFVWDVETSTGLAVVIIAVLTLAVRALGGVGSREGRAVPEQLQHGGGGRAAGVHPARRADRVHPRHAGLRHRRLLRGPRRPELRDRRLRRRGVARQLDDLLLGLVDVLDAVRRHVPGAHLQGPDDPRVRDRRAADPERRELRLVRDPRRRRRSTCSSPARRT